MIIFPLEGESLLYNHDVTQCSIHNL